MIGLIGFDLQRLPGAGQQLLAPTLAKDGVGLLAGSGWLMFQLDARGPRAFSR